jgi:hypothetical protein
MRPHIDLPLPGAIADEFELPEPTEKGKGNQWERLFTTGTGRRTSCDSKR